MPQSHTKQLLAIVALTAAILAPSSAHAADYRYWVAGAQTKVYPTTGAPVGAGYSLMSGGVTMTLSAARSEFEGRQVCLRASSAIDDVWLEPSSLTSVGSAGPTVTIPASCVSVYKVDYVRIARPSYGFHHRGLVPDPLIPMVLANGERLGWNGSVPPSSSRRSVPGHETRAFYVLFRIPEDTAPGTYRGSIAVSGRDAGTGAQLPVVQVPVSITVFPFSIAARTIATSFGISQKWVMWAGTPTHKWLRQGTKGGPGSQTVTETTTFHADQLNGWYRYLSDHRITPDNLTPAWDTGRNSTAPDDAGAMTLRPNYLTDYLGSGIATTFAGLQLRFGTIPLPEYAPPAYVKHPFSSAASKLEVEKYFSTAVQALGPLVRQAYARTIDEPHNSERALVEKYGALIHRVAPGLKVMSTVPSLEFKNKPPRNVDIFVQRMHFFYRDKKTWVDPILRSGRQVWIYTHATPYQNQTPALLLDKPLADCRVFGWLAWDTRASGFLYYSIDHWAGPTKGSAKARDPYTDPLSWRTNFNGKAMIANGDGTLVYPGYYPPKGLWVQGAPPVGSLRMEAIRDGLEDYEYLKLASAQLGKDGADFLASAVIGEPKTMVAAGKPTFPAYPKTGAVFESARAAIVAQLMR